MISLNQHHKIILFITLLFVAGASYLFAIDTRYNNPAHNTDWFSLSFTNHQTESMDFVIENFTSQSNFHWELLAGKEKIADGIVSVAPENKKEIVVPMKDKIAERFTIRVSSDKEIVQEIYKNIK
ncbi:MAG: hypothetical protein WC823_03940 [Parcubacteria group bacterium]|jgi:hypothetical protein